MVKACVSLGQRITSTPRPSHERPAGHGEPGPGAAAQQRLHPHGYLHLRFQPHILMSGLGNQGTANGESSQEPDPVRPPDTGGRADGE